MSTAQHTPALALGEVIKGTGLKTWSTGGDWIEIDATGHGAAAIAVWRMEDEERSPECEARARHLVAAVNACAGVPVEVLEANAAGGVPWSVADQIDPRIVRKELAKLLAEARKIIRASGSRAMAKDWDRRATASIAKATGSAA